MAKKGGSKRINTYFRQTAKSFKAARQTQIFSHIKRNLPFTILKFSKKYVTLRFENVKKGIKKFTLNLPKGARKKKLP